MLYVCENNLYSAGTTAADTLALSDVAARAAGYGIPGGGRRWQRCDGGL